MRQTVPCSKCGSPNELTTMFCRECGTKLDFSQLQPTHFEDEGHPIAKRVLKVAGVVLALLLLAAIGLMIWPSQPTGQEGSNDEALETRRKIAGLYDASKNDSRLRATISEPGLNAYLANVVRRNREEAAHEGSWVQLDSIHLAWDEKSTRVHVAFTLGPVTFTHFVEGTPSVGGGSFVFDVDRARVGHLPLPGPASSLAEGTIRRAFSEMENERFVLENLESLELIDRQARAVTSGS